MYAAKTITMLLVLGLIPLNSVAHASRAESSGQRRLQPQILASRVAMFADGVPICQADLAGHSELTPNFVKAELDVAEFDTGPLGGLRFCEGQDLTSIAQMVSLINFRNQVAAGPLALVPVAVCAAGVAIGAWAGNQVGELMMTDSGHFVYSTLGVTGSFQSLATILTGTFSKIMPASYAAAYGGLIGVSCGLVGHAVGFVYFQSKQPKDRHR